LGLIVIAAVFQSQWGKNSAAAPTVATSPQPNCLVAPVRKHDSYHISNMFCKSVAMKDLLAPTHLQRQERPVALPTVLTSKLSVSAPLLNLLQTTSYVTATLEGLVQAYGS